MTETPLTLRDTRSAVAHVDGDLIALDWDNSALLGGGRGVLIWGTNDPARAQTLADHAVQEQFGHGFTARNPTPGLWRLLRASEDPNTLEWRPAPDGAAAVLFTAEATR